jgi:uncharacterized cupredoxin-like copper-binding protein
MKALLLAVMSLALVACQSAEATAPPPAAIAGAPEVTVVLSEMRFTPTEIRLPTGEVNLKVRNEGRARHDLTVPALQLRIVADPGQTVTAGLRDLAKGRYEAYCGELGHRDGGMKATVIVE